MGEFSSVDKIIDEIVTSLTAFKETLLERNNETDFELASAATVAINNIKTVKSGKTIKYTVRDFTALVTHKLGYLPLHYQLNEAQSKAWNNYRDIARKASNDDYRIFFSIF